MPDISTGLAQAAAQIVQANQSRAEAAQRAQAFAIQAASAVAQIQAQKAQVDIDMQKVELEQKKLEAENTPQSGEQGVMDLAAGVAQTEAQLKFTREYLAAKNQMAELVLTNKKLSGEGVKLPSLSDLKSVRTEVRAMAGQLATLELHERLRSGTKEERELVRDYGAFNTQTLGQRVANLTDSLNELRVQYNTATDPAQKQRKQRQMAPIEAELNRASQWDRMSREARTVAASDPKMLAKASQISGLSEVLHNQAFQTAGNFNEIQAIRTFTDPEVFSRSKNIDTDIDGAISGLVSGDPNRKKTSTARLKEIMLRTGNRDEAKAASQAFLEYAATSLGADANAIPVELSEFITEYARGLTLQGK